MFLHRLDTDLITSRLGNVSNPSVGVVSRLVVDAKETNMNAARCEHWNLELGIDGRSAPRLGADRWHQIHVRLDVAFGLARKALDAPDNRLLFGLVLGAAKGMLDLGLGRVFGDGYLDDDVGRKELIREIGNHLEVDRNSKREKWKKENVSNGDSNRSTCTKEMRKQNKTKQNRTHFVKLCSS